MFPGKAVIPYVDKCGADISNLHRDGRPCSQEDDFWILFFFVYGKIHIKEFISLGQMWASIHSWEKSSFPRGAGGPAWQMSLCKGLSERGQRKFVGKQLSVCEGKQMNSPALSLMELSKSFKLQRNFFMLRISIYLKGLVSPCIQLLTHQTSTCCICSCNPASPHFLGD